MRLTVYAKAKHLSGPSACISNVQNGQSATGIGSVLANKGGLLTLEASTAEEQKLHEQSQIAMKWQSGGLIGGKVKDDTAERSIFAERWERLVTALLYMSKPGHASRASGGARYNTVSFKTSDYVWVRPQRKGSAGGGDKR